ncbi:hypothetical protein D9611_000445 [Ephemerocybe angulata]|uniref:Uncharacterized protein n=1 Tax=Ephemerocybe angulata TaxID=980116 RepID=A0A8H5F6R6_9AGAR|nr:hypothetical protein D9611_000445 [Tulosesus angulatus]
MLTPLLCMLLAPRMVETARRYDTQPRIVIVSREVHYWTSFPEDVYNASSSFKVSSKEYCTPARMTHRYQDSKRKPPPSIINLNTVLNVFFTLGFAELVKNTPVIR